MEQAEEILRCKEDIRFFVEKYVYINDPQTYETFKYEPWPFQLDLFDTFDNNEKTIILKGRQLGVSWIVCMYALHRILFYNNSNVLMLSKREDEAQKLIVKIKFMYNFLPPWLQVVRPLAGRDGGNKKELIIERTKRDEETKVTKTVHKGSVLALPATKDAGRSETASIVIADEWAFHKYGEENWTALGPTIDSGGKFIGVSTANGLGNFYHQQWKGAERGTNDLKPIFLPYDLRPGRDQDWYEKTARGYLDEKLFHQEYPRSPHEAFITTGGCIFDLEGLQFLSDEVAKSPLSIGQITDFKLQTIMKNFPANFKVWDSPKMGVQYIIGADPAGGDAGSDFSTAYVFNPATSEVVATIHGRLAPDQFAGLISELGELYGQAKVVVERNNHGYAVHGALRNSFNYGNIFTFKKDKAFEGDNKEGMPTNTRTKPVMESFLQAAIRDRKLKIYDIEFVFEAQSYVRENGKTGGEGDSHDDRVVAMMMVLAGLEVGNSSRRTLTMGRRVKSERAPYFKTGHR